MKLKIQLLLLVMIGIFSTAVAQDPTAGSLYNDGLAKLKAKEYKEALTLLEKAMEVADPEADEKVIKLAKRNGAFASYYVGNQLRKEKKYDEALATYEKGIGYSTGVYSNYVGIAQALDAKEETAEAVKAYLKAADMTRKAGKDDRADKLVSKAGNFAAIAASKKQYDKAVVAAQAYLDVKDDANAHYYLAVGLNGQGSNEKALEHINKALEMADTEKDRAYFAKAEIHEALGQKAQAIEAYKMVKDAKYAERAKYKVEQLGGK